jgi:hypothetical protein
VIDIPPVVGDPATIKAFADHLRSLASRIEENGADVMALPKGMTFEGPAADDFAAKMKSLGGRARAAAEDLRAVTARVDAAAAEVARRIEERERLIEQMARAAAGVGS